MTGQVQPFVFGDALVRVVLVDGEPWFVAKDVCGALGIVWKRADTLARIPREWIKGAGISGPLGGEQETTVISEPALYKLAFRSNKPEADQFTNWVAADVLPVIRRTGRYDAAEGAAPSGPAALSERQTRLALDQVTEIRLLYGAAAAREAWGALGLIHVPAMTAGATAEPGAGADWDDIARFLIDRTRTDPAGRIQSLVLYRAFADWAAASGLSVWSLVRFGKAMRAAGVEKVQSSRIYYCGLSLTNGPEF